METQFGLIARWISDFPSNPIAIPPKKNVRLYWDDAIGSLMARFENGSASPVTPVTGLSQVFHDATLTGLGTAESPLSVAGGVGSFLKASVTLTPADVNDILTNNSFRVIVPGVIGNIITVHSVGIINDFNTIAYQVTGDGAGGVLAVKYSSSTFFSVLATTSFVESGFDIFLRQPGLNGSGASPVGQSVVVERSNIAGSASLQSLGDGDFKFDIYYTIDPV